MWSTKSWNKILLLYQYVYFPIAFGSPILLLQRGKVQAAILLCWAGNAKKKGTRNIVELWYCKIRWSWLCNRPQILKILRTTHSCMSRTKVGSCITVVIFCCVHWPATKPSQSRHNYIDPTGVLQNKEPFGLPFLFRRFLCRVAIQSCSTSSDGT